MGQDGVAPSNTLQLRDTVRDTDPTFYIFNAFSHGASYPPGEPISIGLGTNNDDSTI